MPLYLAGEIVGVIGIVELAVEHMTARRALLVAEMAHGGKEIGQTALVLGNVGRLMPDLHHQHGVTRRIEPIERGRCAIELIAQDQNQMTQACGQLLLPRRHADAHTLPFSASVISSSTLGSSMVAGMVQG